MAQLRSAGRGSEGQAHEVINLPTAARELLEEARTSRAGRAARTLAPGAHAPLKQTLFALVSGQSLAEHDAPTAATLEVLSGEVRLVASGQETYLHPGDLAMIPPVRHSVDCVDDAVVLLTATTT